MKTIKLYIFKDSVTQKMPLFKEKDMLSSLNDLMKIDIIKTEKVTEYIIDVPDDFSFENYDNDQLTYLCNSSTNTIEYHFATVLNDYDVI
ncbi:hypothetical protein ACM39_06795 [Chryseobacterium sp. FH2]|uniref:hypothetical protein n=1 Tax=Chryseobacterium sp. FH2 TaxID=1674291 RepID=UPI00065AF31A|nr:hypothetical protein [Chryseobacterium sp. FH2]KMQ68979.1 hypothetical protein ACM39_06795 [Chryseobacterium sp. FH2]